MAAAVQTDYSGQQQLLKALLNPSLYPHAVKTVRLIETHISWVLLAGRYAYKLKKAVNLGFLDFTDLSARRFYCEEEIRLNRRLAPQLYLDVVTIGGSPGQPRLGATPAIEYAVRMRRFASAKQMDNLLVRGLVTPQHIDRLAEKMARFHADLPPSAPDSAYGTPAAVLAPVRQNFEQLLPLLDQTDVALLNRLHIASEQEYTARKPRLERRHQQGWVRECHGDLHLGNIVLLKNQPTPFDGIEFNPELRWIDVMSEIAFLVMDLQQRNRADLAFWFLNAYLELSGDYAGMDVLRFYLVYRATVRAKINAIRAHQPEIPPPQAQVAIKTCRDYLRQAASSLEHPRPILIILHGLPGCGKTTVAQAVLEQLQAIRIRSDVERKRLFGLTPLQASKSAVGGGIYSHDATQQTYARLHELARGLLQAGYAVIVDAAFLRQAERAQFRQLAHELDTPFIILNISAPPALLRQRIQQRTQQGSDASEADFAVYLALQAACEPLQPQEQTSVITIENNGAAAEIAQKVQSGLSELLMRRALCQSR